MSRRRALAATPCRGARGEALEALAILTPDLPLRVAEDLGLGYQDQIVATDHLLLTEALSEEALGAIARHRPPHLARGGQAQPAVRAAVGDGHEDEERAVEADPLPEGPPELGAAAEPLGRAQPRPGRRRHPGSGPDPLPPLLPAPLEHKTATLGAHAHEESVRPLPLAVVGLEGPFHGDRPGPGRRAPDGPAEASGQRCKSTGVFLFLSISACPAFARNRCLGPPAYGKLGRFGDGHHRPFRALASAAFPQVLKSLCKKGFVGRLSVWRPRLLS